MAKKKDQDKVIIEFVGDNANQVTGSMTWIKFNDKQILLDCGITQSSNPKKDFIENAKPFPKFKAKNINYTLIADFHGDHSLLIAKLVRCGFRGEIITTHNFKSMMLPMHVSSARIVMKEAIAMKREPYLWEQDVYDAYDRIVSYDYGKVVWLDDEIGFKLLKNSHTIASAQIELYFKKANGNIVTVLYTGDIGNPISENHYVDNLEIAKRANVVISECTYGGKLSNGKNNRPKDLEKIKTVVDKTCGEDGGKVLIPVFAFARSMEVLTCLYEIYGQDDNFKTRIVCDSPLLYNMMREQQKVLEGENLDLFEKVINWSNVRFVREHNEHKTLIGDKTPAVILSSAGMMTHGRVVEHLKTIIGKSNSHILFCGYCGEGTLAHKIQNGQKSVRIDGKNYSCKCNITSLKSFSSHISHENLIWYLSEIQAEKIALVHGEVVGKLLFKDALEKELSKKDNCAKVLAVHKGTIITI